MSITRLPFFKPSTTPPASNSAASTCGVSGTMRTITSLAAATAAPLASATPPAFTNSSGTPERL